MGATLFAWRTLRLVTSSLRFSTFLAHSSSPLSFFQSPAFMWEEGGLGFVYTSSVRDRLGLDRALDILLNVGYRRLRMPRAP